MAQELRLDISGLVTNQSPQKTKPGALVEAVNVNIDAPDTISSRRGFSVYGQDLPGFPDFMTEFDNRIHIHHSVNKLAYDSDGSGAWVDYAGSHALADSKIGFRSQVAQSSLYFTSASGVMRVESLGAAPYLSGIPEALGFSYGPADFLAGTALVNNNWYAYRVVWGRTLPSGQVVLGAPSGRTEVLNDTGGGNKDLNINIPIPLGIDNTFFFQIYRTAGSGSTDTLPNDEMGLVYEDFPTAGELSAGVVSRIDSTPDVGRGPTLYTSPSQEGILQAGNEPPFAKDLCVYKDCLFFANTRTRQGVRVNLLGVGPTLGFLVGDTITIAGVTYTGGVAENPATSTFLVDTSSPTPATRVASTARSICNVVNRSPATVDMYAVYVSASDEFPGKMFFRRRTLAGGQFTVSSNNTTAFNPALHPGAQVVSSNDEFRVNRIYISKPNQPDSVPLLNYVDVGSNDDPILRVIAMRDSVFVFKQSEIWRIIGEDFFSFQVNLFDATARLLAPRTASATNNEIFCYSDQGIVAVSEGGVRIQSWDIENSIKVFSSKQAYPNFESSAWSVSYDSDRRWLMFDGEKFWARNVLTGTWTNWGLERVCGHVFSVDGRLYLADANGVVYQERKNLNKTDFADDEYPVTVATASSGNVVTLVSVPSGVSAGMEFSQGAVSAKIVSVGVSSVVLDVVYNATPGPAGIFKPIKCSIKFSDVFAGNPAQMKRYREFFVGFRDNNREFTVSFENNFNNVPRHQGILPSWVGLTWGSGAWGGIPWGGLTNTHQEYRTYFPSDMQRALWVRVGVITERGFTDFSLNEAAFSFEQNSERFNK